MLFLGNRVLLEDGTSLVEPGQAEAFLSKGLPPTSLAVTELTNEIAKFNQLSAQKIQVFSTAPSAPEFLWSIPDKYKYLDIEQHLIGLSTEKIKRDDPLRRQRELRLAEELALFEERNMFPLLRTLIFVVDRMRELKVVWGVGRGSSCSSYLLYLIGLHHVDPVKYDISVTDFIRD